MWSSDQYTREVFERREAVNRRPPSPAITSWSLLPGRNRDFSLGRREPSKFWNGAEHVISERYLEESFLERRSYSTPNDDYIRSRSLLSPSRNYWATNNASCLMRNGPIKSQPDRPRERFISIKPSWNDISSPRNSVQTTQIPPYQFPVYHYQSPSPNIATVTEIPKQTHSQQPQKVTLVRNEPPREARDQHLFHDRILCEGTQRRDVAGLHRPKILREEDAKSFAKHAPEEPPQTFIYNRPEVESRQSSERSFRCGSPQPAMEVEEIENTDDGFKILLNVAHFEPHELKVSLSGQVLTVSGARIEKSADESETLQRTFNRQYALPDDIRLNTIRALVTPESKTMEIVGKRTTWKETEIDVHFEPAPPRARPKGVEEEEDTSEGHSLDYQHEESKEQVEKFPNGSFVSKEETLPLNKNDYLNL